MELFREFDNLVVLARKVAVLGQVQGVTDHGLVLVDLDFLDKGTEELAAPGWPPGCPDELFRGFQHFPYFLPGDVVRVAQIREYRGSFGVVLVQLADKPVLESFGENRLYDGAHDDVVQLPGFHLGEMGTGLPLRGTQP